MERTRIALIGAGPIGLEMSVALRRNGLEFLHLEAGQIGSTIEWYAPDTPFFSSPERIAIAGVPLVTAGQRKATREEYLAYLRSVVLQFDLRIATNRRVVAVERSQTGFVLRAVESLHGVGGPNEYSRQSNESEPPIAGGADPRTVHADKVILAIGDMHLPRELGIEGEKLPHVSHFFGEPHRYFRKRVLVVGGKNSAAEAALRLYRIGADVTLSYRRAELDAGRIKYWIYPELTYLIRAGAIRYIGESTPESIRAETTRLDVAGRPMDVAADFVFLLTGYRQDPSLYSMFGVELEGSRRKPVFDPATMETNVSGVYVAGTGSAGTQDEGVKEFIETSHVHVERIAAALTGRAAPAESAGRSETAVET